MNRCWFVIAGLMLAIGCQSKPEIHYQIKPTYGIDDPQFRQTISSLLGPPLVGGNKTTTLLNGNQIFPAMLAAIRNSERTINFESYVYWSGTIGKEFADALTERARAGVQVRVILDWVGSERIDRGYLKEMRDAGVMITQYHALRWYDFLHAAPKLNNRTHRKLLIVDGRIGFTGGVGIADEWNGDADSTDHWRDTHYRVEGPVVAQLQAAFMDNWMKEGEIPTGDAFFPKLDPAGEQWAQAFKSGSGGGADSMQLLYLYAVASSRKSLRIGNSYFVPDDQTILALVDAAKRGVKVQILVPGEKIDMVVVRKTSRARWGELLKAGVEIYEYQPTMYHVKLFIADDLWVSIGSSNIDNRSFRLNDEANLNVYDPAFAAEQSRIFDEDLRHSHRITWEDWNHRPLGERIQEAFSNFLTPLL